MQACRLPPSSGAVAVCLMSCLWKSCLTLRGLFQASALGMDPGQGNAWLEKQSSSRLMQEAATMARVAAELYRLVDEPSRQVSRPNSHIYAIMCLNIPQCAHMQRGHSILQLCRPQHCSWHTCSHDKEPAASHMLDIRHMLVS